MGLIVWNPGRIRTGGQTQQSILHITLQPITGPLRSISFTIDSVIRTAQETVQSVTFFRQSHDKNCHTDSQKCAPCHCADFITIDIITDNNGKMQAPNLHYLIRYRPSSNVLGKAQVQMAD